MPQLANKTPLGMCRNCKLNGSWHKSNKVWCFWCHSVKERKELGNQPLQRSPKQVSVDSISLTQGRESEDSEIFDTPIKRVSNRNLKSSRML